MKHPWDEEHTMLNAMPRPLASKEMALAAVCCVLSYRVQGSTQNNSSVLLHIGNVIEHQSIFNRFLFNL